jgi:hypothetical protein
VNLKGCCRVARVINVQETDCRLGTCKGAITLLASCWNHQARFLCGSVAGELIVAYSRLQMNGTKVAYCHPPPSAAYKSTREKASFS